MQNSCKASSHRPEQNSSFYFVEKAIDFPYELRLYSDSVYSWAVTGLPKAALQTSCSLTTSVVIILLSGRDNLKCPRSSEMQDRQQELLTFFFFFKRSIFNAREWHSHEPSFGASLTWQSLENTKHKSPFNPASLQRTLPSGQGWHSWLHENQGGALKAQSLCLSSGTTGGSPPRGTQCKSPRRCDITFKLFKLLSQLRPGLKKQEKTDFFKSYLFLLLVLIFQAY